LPSKFDFCDKRESGEGGYFKKLFWLKDLPVGHVPLVFVLPAAKDGLHTPAL